MNPKKIKFEYDRLENYTVTYNNVIGASTSTSRFVESNNDSTSWYIKKTGSDLNSGTQASPFLTIQKGLDSCVLGKKIVTILDSETYQENLTIKYDASIIQSSLEEIATIKSPDSLVSNTYLAGIISYYRMLFDTTNNYLFVNQGFGGSRIDFYNKTFTSISTGFSNIEIFNNILYRCESTGGQISYSTDLGNTWTPIILPAISGLTEVAGILNVNAGLLVFARRIDINYTRVLFSGDGLTFIDIGYIEEREYLKPSQLIAFYTSDNRVVVGKWYSDKTSYTPEIWVTGQNSYGFYSKQKGMYISRKGFAEANNKVFVLYDRVINGQHGYIGLWYFDENYNIVNLTTENSDLNNEYIEDIVENEGYYYIFTYSKSIYRTQDFISVEKVTSNSSTSHIVAINIYNRIIYSSSFDSTLYELKDTMIDANNYDFSTAGIVYDGDNSKALTMISGNESVNSGYMINCEFKNTSKAVAVTLSNYAIAGNIFHDLNYALYSIKSDDNVTIDYNIFYNINEDAIIDDTEDTFILSSLSQNTFYNCKRAIVIRVGFDLNIAYNIFKNNTIDVYNINKQYMINLLNSVYQNITSFVDPVDCIQTNPIFLDEFNYDFRLKTRENTYISQYKPIKYDSAGKLLNDPLDAGAWYDVTRTKILDEWSKSFTTDCEVRQNSYEITRQNVNDFRNSVGKIKNTWKGVTDKIGLEWIDSDDMSLNQMNKIKRMFTDTDNIRFYQSIDPTTLLSDNLFLTMTDLTTAPTGTFDFTNNTVSFISNTQLLEEKQFLNYFLCVNISSVDYYFKIVDEEINDFDQTSTFYFEDVYDNGLTVTDDGDYDINIRFCEVLITSNNLSVNNKIYDGLSNDNIYESLKMELEII